MTASSPTLVRAFKVPVSDQKSQKRHKQLGTGGTSASPTASVVIKRPAIDVAFVPSTEAELMQCLADPLWRICSGQLYNIMVKEADDESEGGGTIVPFKPNGAQVKMMSRLWHRNLIVKARQRGFCVAPETRVLTADLRWVPIADLKAGDEVVAVDEHPPGGTGPSRRMRTATVQAAAQIFGMAYKIKFDDGREVVCTDQHPWLSKKAGDAAEWRSLSGIGNQVVGKLTVGTKIRWITKPWDEPTFEDGWFGGMLDGEGSMSKRNTSAGLNVCQREGPVWDRLNAYCESRGYSHCIEPDSAERPSKYGKTPVPKIAFGRMDEMFRVIGQTRPTRFLSRRFWEGRELPGKRNGDVGWATITSIEPVGVQPMIDLQTSTGTYIAEGFVSHNTTLACILWLDHALFNADQRCGIIAHNEKAAVALFRDKVKLAYDRLPDAIREMFPLDQKRADELLFAHNNSSIYVATSMRSGTYHRLHVSEYGKICAKFPDKATEIMTGSLPSVPLNGICIIESTAEGREGDFFAKYERALSMAQAKTALTQKDYRIHFSPWWDDEGYRIETDVLMTHSDLKYFDEIESMIGRVLDRQQRNWYVATREAEFGGDPEKMWQEYPSHIGEPFQVSTEGTYYAVQLAAARKEGRICKVPYTSGVPVNTFWDIGNSDGTAIWFHQRVGFENRFIDFMEGWGESYGHYTKEMQAKGYTFGDHYLPHDAAHKRQGKTSNQSPEEMLMELMPGHSFTVVDVVSEVIHGIQAVRDVFGTCFFDQEKCKEGIDHLQAYKKTWDRARGAWKIHTPSKIDGHSEAPDALRQFAQGYMAPKLIKRPQGKRTNWKTA